MNQSNGQNNNTSFAGSSTASSYQDIKVTSSPPLPMNQSSFRQSEPRRRESDDRPGCITAGCGCRAFGCGIFIVIVLFIIGAVFIVVNKPSGIWDSVVTFLNAGVAIPEYNGTTSDSAKNKINDQITKVGENQITMDQDSFTAIVRERLPDLKNPVVEIKPDMIKVYWELDQTVPSNPLYGEIEIKLENQKLAISKVGVERIGTPAFLNDFVSNTALSLLGNKSSAQKDSPYSLLYNFLSPDQNITIKNVSLEKGQAIITIDIKANLF
ncbi:MAG: hypothetical protein ABI721_04520 [Candidatus Dojkabacteria bacterium]